MKIVCVSDTHLQISPTKFKLPRGDVLVHAGDATSAGTLTQLATFLDWMSAQPFDHKVFVAGNHDWIFQKDRSLAANLVKSAGIHYLEDSEVTIQGVKFWGSPWQPFFQNWAFNLADPAERKMHWDMIPLDTDVLVTHSPPFGICDTVSDGYSVGCEELLSAVNRVEPTVHIFGHIHESHGLQNINGTTFVNAAICDGRYRAVNPPITVQL